MKKPVPVFDVRDFENAFKSSIEKIIPFLIGKPERDLRLILFGFGFIEYDCFNDYRFAFNNSDMDCHVVGKISHTEDECIIESISCGHDLYNEDYKPSLLEAIRLQAGQNYDVEEID